MNELDYWSNGFDPRHPDNMWHRDGFSIQVIRHDIPSRFQVRYVIYVRGWGKMVETEVFVDDYDVYLAHRRVGESILTSVEKLKASIERVGSTQVVLDKLIEMARAVIA